MQARRAAGTTNDRFWLAVGRWFSHVWASFGVLLMVAGAALLGLGPDQAWAYWLGAVTSLGGAVWELWKGRRYAQLDASMEAAGTRALERSTSLNTILDSALRVLMSDLSVDFASARVSVYRHLDDSFILLARVSQSLGLEKVGQGQVPRFTGCDRLGLGPRCQLKDDAAGRPFGVERRVRQELRNGVRNGRRAHYARAKHRRTSG